MTKKDAFFQLIRLFDDAGIRYALVGNTDEYPDHIGSDVDIVTDGKGLTRFHHAVWSLEDAGLRVVQCFQHEITAFYYVLAFQEKDGSWGYIQPDICTDYYRRARKLLDAKTMLDRCRKKECPGCAGGGFFVLAPQDEFVYYLLKKIGKKSLSADQFRHLRTMFSEDPEGCRKQLAAFGPASAPALAAIEANDCEGLSVSLPEIKRNLLRSGVLGRPRRFRDAMRKLRRIFHPTGFVAVLPDSETSVFAASLHEALFGAFRRQADLSAREPSLLRKLLKAKIASTFIVLDAMPTWPSCRLVDVVLKASDDPASTILDGLAKRVRSRCGFVRSEASS